MTIQEQLEDILKRNHAGKTPSELMPDSMIARWHPVVVKCLKEAYELGRASKKCKEDKENPYNIDYKRQTKLDL